MPKAYVGGIGIHYQTIGSGRDIILIHGLAANLAFWYLRLVPALSSRLRVTAYDLRGHGYSDMPPHGYTSAEMARDLLALMDQFGIERAHIVGHSFGGTVGLHFASLFPHRVQTLTLADARVHALQPLPRLGDQQYWDRWREDIRKLGIEIPEDTPRVGYSFLEELAREKNLRRDLQTMPFLTSSGMWAGSGRAATRWRALLRNTSALTDLSDPAGLTADVIRQVELPVLAIYGERSHCLPTCRQLHQLLPRCSMVIVPGAGHLYPMVRPAVFLKHLSGFLGCAS